MTYFGKTPGCLGKLYVSNEGATDSPSWATALSPGRRMDRSDPLHETEIQRSAMETVDLI